ncbi:hypothetical protein BU25DRAFT_406981 [Macroventuria anomochaeta]|uniref:Uncharacterized protein n=1 Tax=Macroventuria anomochaeta TaxID=301207 RepID=A0ACB6SE67_9PLEO|nr:uncharacterized protein BU25DRAFT_406981 [Macroventuria anomochaeta]KAF2632456.1 hypothetical protein BU25DRAFT_406981 [Macroventuria anomochaeta]
MQCYHAIRHRNRRHNESKLAYTLLIELRCQRDSHIAAATRDYSPSTKQHSSHVSRTQHC